MDNIDQSYADKMGKVSAEDHDSTVIERRAFASRFFDALPPTITALTDHHMDALSPAVRKKLLEIEQLGPTWKYDMAENEVLGRQFDETVSMLWSCSRATGAFLHTMVLSHRPMLILELGTSIGYSTLWMADACKKAGGRIKTIECLPIKVELARRNFAACGVEDIVDVEAANIMDVLDNWQGPGPDMVFMDPAKQWQKAYLSRLKKIMPAGGLLITDNAFDNHDIIEEYLHDLQDGYFSVFAGIDTAGTIISVKK
jgi:predicted O-methyltransferase YrrM